MRPVLHFAPARGWLNDPNGLIDHRGKHHFFYQHNPDELRMVNMCWGHASSPDLLTWTEQPIALRPGPPGSYDDDGCWSGCAVRDGDSVALIYSAHHEGVQLPCLARPKDDDLVGWEKFAHNPVVEQRPPLEGITDMRDHSVRWDGDRWRQVLAGGAAGEGMLFGYSSADLENWSWDGVVLRAGDAGLPGRVWECPDVFQSGNEVVAITSLIDDDRSPVVWVVGDLDRWRIRPRRWGLVDYGDRLYAPQSYTDHTGRRVMFGWLRTHLDPAALGQENLGVASLPRILSVVDGRLHQEPAAELISLRGEPRRIDHRNGSGELLVQLDGLKAFEIHLDTPSVNELLSLQVDLDDGDGHSMTVDLACFAETGRLPGDADRDANRQIVGSRTATLVFDTGIVEMFLDDGRAASRTDAAVGAVRRVAVRGQGDATTQATVWPLRAPQVARPSS